MAAILDTASSCLVMPTPTAGSESYKKSHEDGRANVIHASHGQNLAGNEVHYVRLKLMAGQLQRQLLVVAGRKALPPEGESQFTGVCMLAGIQNGGAGVLVGLEALSAELENDVAQLLQVTCLANCSQHSVHGMLRELDACQLGLVEDLESGDGVIAVEEHGDHT